MKFNIFLVVGLLLGIILSGCTSSSSEPAASAPEIQPRVEPLEVTIEMSEYAFDPAEIETIVGQDVTLTLVNVGTLEHELMIGKNVEMHDGIPSGYEVDLFRTANILPTVDGDGMLMAHDEGRHQDEESMDMEGDDHEEGMEGDDHEEGMDMNLDGDGALMVMMPIGPEATTVKFTITEDMIGEWEIGCFEQDGVHYNSGMVGTFTVKK